MTPPIWSGDKWRSEVEGGLVELRELDETIPTRLVYGADALGRLSFGFITKKPFELPHLSEAVAVERAPRDHGTRWISLFRLSDPMFTDVFVDLCESVYKQMRSAENEDVGLSAATQLLKKWQHLFTAPRSRRLTIEQCRGLYAELVFGFHHIAPHIGAANVVESWQGPFGSDQDFEFDNVHYEVKSIHSAAHSVRISSEYQLHGDKIVLVTLEVSDSRLRLPGYMSLSNLIEKIQVDVSADHEIRDLFDAAIDHLGVDLEDNFYKQLMFKAADTPTYYQVSDTFPRLTPEALPLGVSGTTYRIQLTDISTYAMEVTSALILTDSYRNIP